jgi:hypothetical protein
VSAHVAAQLRGGEKLRNRRTFLKRIVSLIGSLALAGGFLVGFVGLAGPASATPLGGSTSTCTYAGPGQTTPSPVAATGVTPGGAVTVSCTNMPIPAGTVTTASFILAEASPLGGVIDPATAASSEADTAAIGTLVATGTPGTNTGTGTATFTVPNPFTTGATGDPNGVCPPSQAQVNAGLVACALAVVSGATPINTGLLLYATNPTPAAPTLHLSPGTAGIAGDVFNASDAAGATSFWWGSALTTVPSVAPAPVVPGFTTAFGTVAATNNLSTTADVYCFTGHTSAACTGVTTNTNMPPKLSGTITMPAGVAAGATTVKADEPNTTPFAGNGTLAAIIPGTVNVEGTSAFTSLGTPAITVSPSTGGPGTLVSVSGTNWDPQGSAVHLAFTSPSSPTAIVDSANATAVADGTFSGTLTVTTNELGAVAGTPPASNPIVATQTPKVGTALTATAAFTVKSLSASCSTAGGTATPACTISQIVNQTVAGSTTIALSLAEGGTPPTVPTVTLTPITLSGFFQTATGALSQVQLIDARGTLVGWSLTAQFNSATFGCTPASGTGSCPGAHPIDNTIPSTNFVLMNPRVVCASISPLSCIINEVTQPAANTPVPGGTGASAVSLGSAAPGGGGGSFAVSSNVTLNVPPFIAAGVYSNTLNMTVQ